MALSDVDLREHRSRRFVIEPWKALSDKARHAILYGLESAKLVLQMPPGAKASTRSTRAARCRSAASRGASSAITGATDSRARSTRGWRPGWTR